jgi:OmpA-OmpF porin, OOP family
MANSLMESIMAMLPQVEGALASRLGESGNSVKRGVETSAAAMIATLGKRAGEPGFMSTVLNLLISSGQPAAMAAAVGSASSTVAPAGEKFLTALFGADRTPLLGSIARTAGLQRSSAEGILGAVAPMLMGVLGGRVRQGGLGASSCGAMLASEAAGIGSLLPVGFSSLMGGAATAAASVRPAAPGWRTPLIVFAVLLMAGLIWLLTRGNHSADVATAATSTVTTAVTETAKPAVSALGEFLQRKLANGVELNIPVHGIENKLLAFIDDQSKAVDKTTWFDFDRLLFDTGKSTLQPASQEQLQNIAAILKAYPKVNVKMGGYTDNVGEKNANLALSAARARSVTTELTALGVDASRMTSEGYGDEHPVADNSTEAGRAQNRRISIRVTAK